MNTLTKLIWVVVIVLSISINFNGPIYPQEKASDKKEKTGFDYSSYAKVLKAYVDDTGMVDYKGLKKNRKDLDDFNSSLGDLDKKVYTSWNDEEKIAFMVNAYNSFTLQAIIDNFPIKKGGFFASRRYPHNSIRQIPDVWDDDIYLLMGKKVSLEYIEHKVLRKDFNQPYIHMALVCAAMSCPKLRNEPYVASKIKDQFKDQTVDFLKNKTRFYIDREKKEVYISAIFKWFDSDFRKSYGTPKTEFKGHGADDRAVLNFISKHLTGKDREYLLTREYDIEYLKYDWALNEQKESKKL